MSPGVHDEPNVPVVPQVGHDRVPVVVIVPPEIGAVVAILVIVPPPDGVVTNPFQWTTSDGVPVFTVNSVTVIRT
jgi:hypothetical protein